MSNPSIYGKLTDTYTSTTKPDSLVVGQVYFDNNTGKEYKFCLNGAVALAIGAALKPDPVTAGLMLCTTDVTDAFESVNTTGSIIAISNYFWAQTRGDVSVLVLTTINAGVLVNPSATDGTLGASAAAEVNHIRCVTLVSSGSGGLTSCRLY